MIITRDFVYLHLPKTGGTFIATMLMRIHEERGDFVETVHTAPGSAGQVNPYFKRLRRKQGAYCVRLMLSDRYQHGHCGDIPIEYRDLPVVATIRNPYDRYVSQFKFGWWQRNPSMFGGLEAVQKDYPTYPDLDFGEFVRFANDRLLPAHLSSADGGVPGFQTQQFVAQYFCNPDNVLRKLSLEYVKSEAFVKDLCPVRFVHQERLSEELAGFLAENSYRDSEIDTVRSADRIYPPEGGRPATDDWKRYYSPNLKTDVRARERLLLAMLPEYDS
jgi:hypothetical protein